MKWHWSERELSLFHKVVKLMHVQMLWILWSTESGKIRKGSLMCVGADNSSPSTGVLAEAMIKHWHLLKSLCLRSSPAHSKASLEESYLSEWAHSQVLVFLNESYRESWAMAQVTFTILPCVSENRRTLPEGGQTSHLLRPSFLLYTASAHMISAGTPGRWKRSRISRSLLSR